MRDHHYFEAYARHNRMFPQGFVDTDKGRILLADSETPLVEDGRIFYRTAFCIYTEGADIASSHEYEWGETGASHTERQARLKEAVDHAYEHLTNLYNAGFYDDERKADFSSVHSQA